MNDKIKIIDQICTRHPSYGVDKGWSWYHGGMADTGDWYFRKMLDVPTEELQAFLDEIITEENKPVIPLTPEEEADTKIINHYSNGAWMNEYERKLLMNASRKFEHEILFGKMNDIQEYIRIADHIKDGTIPIKKTIESGYIPVKRTGMCKITDGKIVEMTLSQSLIKQVYWTGPPTNHVGSWDMREDACAWKFYNLNIINKYRYPQGKAMMLGNFFETLAIGGGAYSKTLSIPANMRNGEMTVDEERVLDAVERFKRVAVDTGIIVGESNTQVEFKMPVIDPSNPDVKVYFKGVADIISPFYYQDINYDTCIVDIKLAKDRNLTFSNPYKPWEQFSWGAPEQMSVFQGTSYSEGFQLPFINLVFDYPKENPGWKVVPVKTIVSHSDDPEARLRSREMKQGIRNFISQLVEWNDEGWKPMKNYSCPKCIVSNCPIKNQIEHI